MAKTNKGAEGEQRVAAQDNQDAARAAEVQGESSGSVEVKLNPRLVERTQLKQVEIGGSYFYRDSDVPQYATEEQTKEKDAETGLQFLVTKKGG